MTYLDNIDPSAMLTEAVRPLPVVCEQINPGKHMIHVPVAEKNKSSSSEGP
jgi:hypothetical protein